MSQVDYDGIPQGYRSVGRHHGTSLSAREEIRRAHLASINADEHGAIGEWPSEFSSEWELDRWRNAMWADGQADRTISRAKLWYLANDGRLLSFHAPPGFDRHRSFVLGSVVVMGDSSKKHGRPLMISESELAALIESIARRPAKAGRPRKQDEIRARIREIHPDTATWKGLSWKRVASEIEIRFALTASENTFKRALGQKN